MTAFYPDELDDVNVRQRRFEELLCALRGQKVDGKHVHLNLEPLLRAYGQVERVLGNETGVNDLHRADGLHCATCQCNKLHPTPPIPGNPMSRSWHDDSAARAATAQWHAEARAEADEVLRDVFTERPKS